VRTEEGLCYVVRERKPFLAYKLFEGALAEGVPGLCVTRQFPDKVREIFDLKDTRILWLSHTPGKDHHNPTSIGTLATIISSFIERYRKCFVLIDGLEYLVINNGFQQVLRFVEHINEQVMQSQSTVLVPISPSAFSEKELALVERNVQVIEQPAVSVGLEKDLTTLIDEYR
jgi:archaellum biogenesis ATPase FlaH